MLIAIFHIVGAMLVTLVFGAIVLFVASWESERNKKVELQNLATKLGVAVEELTDEKFSSKVVELTFERFSDERLSNRLSDFCGFLRAAWDLLGSLLQVGVLLGVVWYTITESITNAIYAWWIVPIGLFFWIAGTLFAFACRLLTGRYPGQAKQTRKAMADFLSTRRKQMPSSEGKA